jgi:hypothetical protein
MGEQNIATRVDGVTSHVSADDGREEPRPRSPGTPLAQARETLPNLLPTRGFMVGLTNQRHRRAKGR